MIDLELLIVCRNCLLSRLCDVTFILQESRYDVQAEPKNAVSPNVVGVEWTLR